MDNPGIYHGIYQRQGPSFLKTTGMIPWVNAPWISTFSMDHHFPPEGRVATYTTDQHLSTRGAAWWSASDFSELGELSFCLEQGNKNNRVGPKDEMNNNQWLVVRGQQWLKNNIELPSVNQGWSNIDVTWQSFNSQPILSDGTHAASSGELSEPVHPRRHRSHFAVELKVIPIGTELKFLRRRIADSMLAGVISPKRPINQEGDCHVICASRRQVFKVQGWECTISDWLDTFVCGTGPGIWLANTADDHCVFITTNSDSTLLAGQ